VVARQTLLGSWFRRLTAGLIVAVIALAAGAVVMTRLPDAEAQAPKQPPPAQKQQPQQQSQAPKPAQIDRNGVLILIRETLLALDQANKTGNYTVLRDLGSPDFQANSAAQLAEIFAQQRRDNIDLSGVAVIDPQLTLLPQIEANGMMRMAGFFLPCQRRSTSNCSTRRWAGAGGCSGSRSRSAKQRRPRRSHLRRQPRPPLSPRKKRRRRRPLRRRRSPPPNRNSDR
jgi:hypothetical protein